MHARTHSHAHMRTLTHMYACMHSHGTRTHACMHSHTLTGMHTRTHSYTNVHTYAFIHACTYTHVRMHALTGTRMLTNAYMHSRTLTATKTLTHAEHEAPIHRQAHSLAQTHWPQCTGCIARLIQGKPGSKEFCATVSPQLASDKTTLYKPSLPSEGLKNFTVTALLREPSKGILSSCLTAVTAVCV